VDTNNNFYQKLSHIFQMIDLEEYTFKSTKLSKIFAYQCVT